jgi:WD40 repeat protein
MKKKVIVFGCLALCLVVAGLFLKAKWSASPEAVQTGLPPHSSPPGTDLVVSPRGDKAVSYSVEGGASQVWLVSLPTNTRLFVARLAPGDGVRNISWSPDGRWFAFESYNLDGHSPMTTSHVWLAQSDAAVSRKLALPPPNERFSAYVDRWIDSGTLRIRSTLLESPEDVFYLFHLDTLKMEGPARVDSQ